MGEVDKLAFVFAGQGAQAPGMGRDLYEHSPAARAVFDAAESVRPGLRALCFEGPSEELNLTNNTQPCLFATDLACARALEEAGITPDGVAGFSLGEFPAACLAGWLGDEAGFALVCCRADAMHACGTSNPGAMYAVLKLPADKVESIATDLGSAWPVNYNCPGQIVVACETSIGPELQKAVAAAGGRALPLPVSGAFHSPLMDGAVAPLGEQLRATTFGTPRIPVYANATGRPYDDPVLAMLTQVNHPVLWQQTVENMIADGYSTFIEVGPGKTLSGFIRKIDGSVRVGVASDQASLAAVVEEFSHA